MPKLRTVVAQQQAGRTNQFQQFARASDFGGGQGLIQAGKAAGQLADQQQASNDRADQVAADDIYNREKERMLLDNGAARQGVVGSARDFATNQNNVYRSGIDTTLDASGLGKVGKDRLRKRLHGLRVDVLSTNITWGATVEAKYQRGVITKTTEVASNAARSDPAMFANGLKDIKSSISASGLDANSQAKELKDQTSTLAFSTITGVISKDPQAALDMLKEKTWKDHLHTPAYNQLTRAAESAKKAAAQSAATQHNKNMADARASMRTHNDRFAVGNMGTEEEVRITTEKVNATGDPELMRQWSEAQSNIPTIKSYTEMDLPTLKQAVAEMPKVGDVATMQQTTLKLAAQKILNGKQTAVNNATRDLIADAKTILKSNEPLGAETQAALQVAAERTDDNTLRTSISDVLNQNTVDAFKDQPVGAARANLTKFVETADEDGVRSSQEAHIVTTLQAVIKDKEKVLSSDGALTYEEQVNPGTVAPLDPSNDMSVSARVETALELQTKHGSVKPEFFTTQEASDLNVQLDEAAPEEVAGTMASLMKGAGSYAPAMLSELSKKMGPQYAIIGSMARERSTAGIGVAIARGAKLRRDALGKGAALTDDKFRVGFEAYFGGALQDAGTNTKKGLMEAAKSLYVASGKDLATASEQDVGEVLRTIVQDSVHNYNGRSTILPAGMTPESFSNKVNSLSQDQINAGFGGEAKAADGTRITPADIRLGQFVYQNPGQYTVVSKLDGTMVMDENHRPKVFNFGDVQ